MLDYSQNGERINEPTAGSNKRKNLRVRNNDFVNYVI